MGNVRHAHRTLDIACSLTASQAEGRLAAWARLRREALLAVEPLGSGVRLWLAEHARHTAEELASREAACCGFLDLEVGPAQEGRFFLEITSPRPEAMAVIAELARPLDGPAWGPRR